MKKYISKGLMQDLSAPKTKKGQPFFIREKGERVYVGFPLIPETKTNGFTYGAITNFLQPDNEKGCLFGDGFIQAPDGSRAGLVWQVSDDVHIEQISEPEKDRWGVYSINFPKPIKNLDDLVFNFKKALPLLVNKFNQVKKQ